MTKEQSIQILNKVITTKFINDYSIDNTDKEAIETVLNLLKEKEKQDDEIEIMKEEFERLEDLEDNTIQLELLLKEQKAINKEHQNQIGKLEVELSKAEKVIDLMAEWMKNHFIYFDGSVYYCEIKSDLCSKNKDCDKCLKQYFESKVGGKDE